MGNCQAAETATVVIQHPSEGKVERIYWSVNASEVMNSNPGYYVAMILASSTAKTDTGGSIRQLKLLRPDDTLLIGHVYRLISFEDVLKEFSAKKSARLGKLMKERGRSNVERKKSRADSGSNSNSEMTNVDSNKSDQHIMNDQLRSSGSGSRSMGRNGQWRPALQSIAEAAGA